MFISIWGANSTIYFSEVNFSENVVAYQLVNIVNTKAVYFNNVTCQNTNANYETNKMTIGGCFRMQNVLSIQINNMKVENSFSRSTAVGLKILDDENTLKNLGSSYNMNISLVSLIVFFNNN